MTDKEWETLLESTNVKLVDFVKKEENKIILQVIKNIIDKDKTRTLDELAQEHSPDAP
jgi:phosphomevalonate kinase